MPKVFGPNLAVEQIESLWIVLRPPFKDCLSKDRINPTLSCFSYELDKYPPHMIALDLPEIEVIVASYLRQSLASGRLHGFLLEETGEFTQLPDTFWRTERGEGALMNEHPLIAQIDGRTAIGYPFVNFEQICDAWKQTYKNKDLPKAISSENTTLGLSPYIGIMIAASNHFGLVNGQLPDGSRVMKDEVERWLDKNWTPDLGEKSPKMISNMATFVRHPDDGRGGNVKSALSNLTRKSIPDRSETERKEIGPDT